MSDVQEPCGPFRWPSVLQVRTPGTTIRKTGAYIGYAGYASVLAVVRIAGVAPASLVALVTGIDPQRTRLLLKQFLVMRLVHRAGWHRPTGRGIDLPLYAFGDGEDAPARPTADGRPMPHADFRPRIERRVLQFASVCHAMTDEPACMQKLEHESGVCMPRLSELLAHMTSPAVRIAHIGAWQARPGQPGGPPMKAYMMGFRKCDANRPKPRGRTLRDERRMLESRLAKPMWKQMTKTLASVNQPRSNA